MNQTQIDLVLGAARAADAACMNGTIKGANVLEYLAKLGEDAELGPVQQLALSLRAMVKRLCYAGSPPACEE